MAVAAWLFLGAAIFPAVAVEPSEMLKNPVLEARARTISKELRCLVCQNESIDESNADLAHDLRVLLRRRLAAGDTDRQAIDFIVRRYGDFVLLKPPVEPATYFLWFGPAALLIVGAAGALLFVRRRNRTIREPAPLSAQEQQRLETLMREPD
ncbi:MAG TPA: cytochrome c-type biogenesis protein [Stellaceae bacterium]|nr:cytochrome c-type biogenesis protein [Stellaceae bacterium]